MSHRTLIIVSIALLLTILIIGLDTQTTGNIIQPKQSESEYIGLQLFPDPYFEYEPDIVIEGDSGEFSHKYEQNESTNIVALTWNHTPGVEIDFLQDYRFPFECEDYIYFKRSFYWDYEVIPRALNITTKYRIEKTGSFLTEWESMYMFQAQAWIRNSLGVWQYGTYFYPNHVNSTFEWQMFDGWQLRNLFESLVEDDDGHQTAPNDTIDVFISLSPTMSFLDWNEEEPWRDYNGSISLMIESYEMNALVATEMNDGIYTEPQVNRTWCSHITDYYPNIEAMSAGYSYLLGNNASDQSYSGFVLGKFDSEFNEIWKVRSNDSVIIYGVKLTVSPDAVYIVGTSYTTGNDRATLVVVKTSHQGEMLWSRSYDFGGYSFARDIAVSNGEIYVISEQSGTYGTLYYDRVALTKIDQDGELEWNNRIPEITYGTELVETDSDGNIFTLTAFSIRKWNSDGDIIWEIEREEPVFYKLEASSSGDIYVAEQPTYGISNLIKYNGEAEKQWEMNLNIKYVDGWKEFVHIDDIEVEPTGSVYLLESYHLIEYGQHIKRISPDGDIIFNMTITENDELQYFSYFPMDISAPGNGQIYASGVRRTDRGYMYELRRYNDNTYFSLTVVVLTFAPIIGVVGLIVVFILLDKAYVGKS